jgi:hypothetical protein
MSDCTANPRNFLEIDDREYTFRRSGISSCVQDDPGRVLAGVGP